MIKQIQIQRRSVSNEQLVRERAEIDATIQAGQNVDIQKIEQLKRDTEEVLGRIAIELSE